MLSLTAQGNDGNKYVLLINNEFQKDEYAAFFCEASREEFYEAHELKISLGMLIDEEFKSELNDILSDKEKEEFFSLYIDKMNKCLQEIKKYGGKYICKQTWLVER